MLSFIFGAALVGGIIVGAKVSLREAADGETVQDARLAGGLLGTLAGIVFFMGGMAAWGLGQLYFWILFL